MALYGMDYKGYTFSFLKRRLAFVFSELKIRKLNQLFERLPDEDFRENVKYHMAVPVTELFRDPGFWRSLRNNVFPLFGSQRWSAWFPDITSGEEVFSLTVLLKEEGLLEHVDILCQHPSIAKCREVSEGFLESKNAELNYSNYRRLEENDMFQEYFYQENGRLRFQKELLKQCRCRNSWLENDHETEGYDFIMFRNSGINYTFQQKEEILKKMVTRLNPGGIIALGVKESMPRAFHGILLPFNEKESIYRRTGVKKI